MIFKNKIKNNLPDWHEHLIALGGEESAHRFFVDQVNPAGQTYQPRDNFFASPFLEEFPEADEGQLGVDVYETRNSIVVKALVAGVDPAQLQLSLNHDLLTIRGVRHSEEEVDERNYFYRECEWNSFSRSIILPVAVVDGGARANIKNGVLTIILPKVNPAESINIPVESID